MKNEAKQELTDAQKLDILLAHIEELDLDDVENSIRNATRCLKERGYLELHNMVSDYFYRAGINHTINQMREAVGLPRLDDGTPKIETIEVKAMPNRKIWDCPKLEASSYEFSDGSAMFTHLGDDGDSMVIGTRSIQKALKLFKKAYESYGLFDDEIPTADAITLEWVVWRNRSDADDEEYSVYYSWEKHHQTNRRGAWAFIYRT